MSQVPLAGHAIVHTINSQPGEETIYAHVTDNPQLTDFTIAKNATGVPNTGKYSVATCKAAMYVSADDYGALLGAFPLNTEVAFCLTYESTLTKKNVVRFDCPNVTVNFVCGATAGATPSISVNA